MAGFSRANGDLNPVAVFDAATFVNSGVDAVTDGVTVQPQGPKLQFFTVTATGALTGAQVNTIIQTVTQLSTVHMYEYTNDTNDSVALAVYPVAAWTAGAIDTALTAAGVTGTTTAAGGAFSG
jgi:hypothetical protein